MQFTDWSEYHDFRMAVLREDRFGRCELATTFLSKFRAGLEKRQTDVQTNRQFYRAVDDYNEQLEPYVLEGSSLERIRPKRRFVGAGRSNAELCPVYYLASSKDCAVAEIRPWIDQTITIASMTNSRPLKLIDLAEPKFSIHINFLSASGQEKDDAETLLAIEEHIWGCICGDFALPVRRDDATYEYAVTQLLAAEIRAAGYDGLAHKSSARRGEHYCFAIFDLEAIKLVDSRAHKIKDIEICHEDVSTR